MKRVFACIFSLLMSISFICNLASCSASSSTGLIMGEWLKMINNSFGMETTSANAPYYDEINENNIYFQTVQIAAAWGVIDTSVPPDVNKAVTWEEAITTLVNAGELLPKETSREDMISFATEYLDDRIRTYWMDRDIDLTSATNMLVAAQSLWVNRTYEEPVCETEYLEEVVDLTEDPPEFTVRDREIVMEQDENAQIKEGDIIVLPASGGNGEQYKENMSAQPYRVEALTETPQEKVIIQIDDDKPSLSDFVDTLYVENTFKPNFSDATIYDGNGRLVKWDSPPAESQTYALGRGPVISPAAAGEPPKIEQTGSSANISFETPDKIKIKGKITSGSISASLEIPVAKGVSAYGEIEVNDFEVTQKIDYKMFTLNSAELKVDYSTKSTVGLKRELVKMDKSWDKEKWRTDNSFMDNLLKNVWAENSDDPKTTSKLIHIASIKVYSVGVADISLDVNIKIAIDGSIEMICTENGSRGIEYKNKNFRLINNTNRDRDLKFKCSAEATLSVGPVLNAFGLAILGFKAEAGLGVQGSATVHLADADYHLLAEISTKKVPPERFEAIQVSGLIADAAEIEKLANQLGGTYEIMSTQVDLHTDICYDLSAYFIFKLVLDRETLAGDILKGVNVSAEWEILGSDNAKFLNVHIEENDFSAAFGKDANNDKCTLTYTPFDGAKKAIDKNKDEKNTDDIGVGELIEFAETKLYVSKGKTATVKISQLPEGYTMADVKFESSDRSIATVTNDGVITGISGGTVTIIASTSDGKYSRTCAVTVDADETVDFTPLSEGLLLKQGGEVQAA